MHVTHTYRKTKGTKEHSVKRQNNMNGKKRLGGMEEERMGARDWRTNSDHDKTKTTHTHTQKELMY